MKRKPDREVLMMRVQKGALAPADSYTAQRLRDKGFHIGDLVGIEIRKIRNPGFHRLAHALGDFMVKNVETFENLNAHTALKRLQREDGVACDDFHSEVGGEKMLIRVPRSLSFESMDDGEFHEVYGAMCRHVAKTYFEGLDEEQVVAMVEMMPQAA
jgi:hypothetical protein